MDKMDIPKSNIQKADISKGLAELTPVEEKIIEILARRGLRTYYELYEKENAGSKGAVSQALNRLIKKELIEIMKREPFRRGIEKKYYGLTLKGVLYAIFMDFVKPEKLYDVITKNETKILPYEELKERYMHLKEHPEELGKISFPVLPWIPINLRAVALPLMDIIFTEASPSSLNQFLKEVIGVCPEVFSEIFSVPFITESIAEEELTEELTTETVYGFFIQVLIWASSILPLYLAITGKMEKAKQVEKIIQKYKWVSKIDALLGDYKKKLQELLRWAPKPAEK